MALFDELRAELLRGLWMRPGEIPGFLKKVRAELTAPEIATLLDELPPTRTGTTGDALGTIADGLQRIREDLLRTPRVSSDIVFISCGQYATHEKELGKAIAMLVSDLTPYTPFFAENVQSPNGLTAEVLENLDRAIGFICVMHERGTITRPDGTTIVRGSVFVEQEIAVVAYRNQVLKRPVKHLAAFAKRGLGLEGMREFIILNALPFDTEEEVLTALRAILPTWRGTATQRIAPVVEIKNEGGTKRKALVFLENRTNRAVDRFRVDILIPQGLIPPKTSFGHAAPELRTATQEAVRLTSENRWPDGALPVYPNDRFKVFELSYEIDEGAWLRRDSIAIQELVVRVASPDLPPATETMSVAQLGLDGFAPPEPIELSADCRGHSLAEDAVNAARSAGHELAWRYETEVPDVKFGGHPYFFVNGRRVVTYRNRNNGKRDVPPED